MKGNDRRVRLNALEALARIGVKAQAAVPTLLDALKDTDPVIRYWAADTLKKIDPDAAKKAGVP